MKLIKLTNNQVCKVDDEDFDRINSFTNWKAQYRRSTKSYYAARYEWDRKKVKLIYMSRFIMNTPEGMICDHINHDTLDNRKENLRNCSYSQNSMNKRLSSYSKTGVNGVHLDKGRFRVVIKVKGKYVVRKYYPTLEDAIKARIEFEKIYFEEFSAQ